MHRRITRSLIPTQDGSISRRGLLTGGSATGLALLLAACSGSSDSASPAGSASWSMPTSDPTSTINVVGILDPVADGMKGTIAAFNKAHPGIKVNYQYVPFDQLNSILDARITNKTGNPDVYWADEPRIPALATRGYCEDLTAQFKGLTGDLSKAGLTATSYQDKLWAVPIADSTQLLYYNADLLAKAGITAPSADPDKRMTWEQLGADALKAKQAGAQYGLLFGQFDRYYQLQPLPMSLGGSDGATGDGKLTPDITSDAWVKAFDWYRGLFASGAAPRGVTSEQTDPLFLAGKAAYEVQGPWMLPNLNTSKVKWGVAPQPAFAGGKAVTPTGSWSLAMNPFSKNKEAAALFLKWMAIDGGSGYSSTRPNPELPANTVGQKAYFARPVFATPQGRAAATIIAHETANTAVNRVPTVGFIEFESLLGQALADIRNGQQARPALTNASEQIATAWKKYA